MPGVVNVNENLSSVSSAFDLKTFALDVTVCGISSPFVQVTVVACLYRALAAGKGEVVDRHRNCPRLVPMGAPGRRDEDLNGGYGKEITHGCVLS